MDALVVVLLFVWFALLAAVVAHMLELDVPLAANARAFLDAILPAGGEPR